MNNKNYYKEDLCDGDGNCKLYNPLRTQGQCKYLNEWYEQKDKIKILEIAVDLACNELKAFYGDDITQEQIQEELLELAQKNLEK